MNLITEAAIFFPAQEKNILNGDLLDSIFFYSEDAHMKQQSKQMP